MIVVDANVIVYFLVPGVNTDVAEMVAARDDDWHVPALWRSEVRSALLGIVRAQQLHPSDAIASMIRAEQLLAGAAHDVDSAHVLELALSSGCSAYDCEYVSLAERLDVPLVTADAKVLHAFPGRAVDLTSYMS